MTLKSLLITAGLLAALSATADVCDGCATWTPTESGGCDDVSE